MGSKMAKKEKNLDFFSFSWLKSFYNKKLLWNSDRFHFMPSKFCKRANKKKA